MLNALEKFDRVTAAGILARAALAVEDDTNPASQYRLPDEKAVRQALLFELYGKLGIQPGDDLGRLELLADAMDQESDELLGPVDQKSALESLSAKGDLPSDLLQVYVDKTVAEVYKDKTGELLDDISETVKKPDSEQHFNVSQEGLALVSLFLKRYDHPKYPMKGYWLLVAGQRQGTILRVQQVWKVFAQHVPVERASSIVEILESFAHRFGLEVTVGGKKGSFFYQANIAAGSPINADFEIERKPNDPPIEFHMVYFGHRGTEGKNDQVSLVVAIDVSKYLRAVAQIEGT